MASLRLLRHATLTLEYAGTTLLVDPMLGERGSMPPIPDTPNDRRNPLVELPETDLSHDALLVTHRHRDHLDDAATERLAGDVPVLCQPEDAEGLADAGFTDPQPVGESVEFAGVRVTRTPARHGHGDLAERMAPVSGFVLEAEGEPTLYHAGDTVWYDGVAETLASYEPDVVVVNAGAAQFTEGRPITMTAEDVLEVCGHTDATVVADHMDAINHCLLTREDLRAALAGTGFEERVAIPADGERVDLGGG